MRYQTLIMGFVAITAALVALGCAATPAEHSYITDYQVVGDKTVKYIYLPGGESRAGGAYLDQGLAVEICSLEPEAIEGDGDDEGEDDAEGEEGAEEQEEVASDDEAEEAQEAEEIAAGDRTRFLTVETDCEQTRLLKTEEFR